MTKRNTIQRQLVIDAVSTLANHPTAEDVYKRIIVEYPDISKGTVYRNLNSLVATGLLSKVCIPGGADRFDHIAEKHYHLKCTHCGKFSDVDMNYIESLDAKIAKATGYEMESHEIIFCGRCADCQVIFSKSNH